MEILKPTTLMARALEAAQRIELVSVRPNPRVGAAIRLKDGSFHAAAHERWGQAHAEKNLLDRIEAQGFSAEGAEMAVTLEPCAHFGKTPPCADLLIQKKIKKVYVGVRDPNPRSRGGVEKLRQAGIEVVEDVCREECESLNAEWLQAHRKGRPFVRLKMATSMDGVWAPQDPSAGRAITSSVARSHAMDFRARSQVIITGSGTILSDDPRYDLRADAEGPHLRYPGALWVLSSAGQDMASVLRGERQPLPEKFSPKSLAKNLKIEKHPDLFFLRDFDLDLWGAQILKEHEIYSIAVEAGPRVSGTFLARGWVDEIYLYMNSRILGGDAHAARLTQTFTDGKLPGLETQLLRVETLSPTDLFMVLRPSILHPDHR